jgi:hypothetical protein
MYDLHWTLHQLFFVLEGVLSEYEDFIEKYALILHPHHFHMITAKHSLLQMMGRTEGCLIQDMSMEQVGYIHTVTHSNSFDRHFKMSF